MRVLVIEDDEELAETVAAGLRDALMAVDVALDGGAGLARALVHDYDRPRPRARLRFSNLGDNPRDEHSAVNQPLEVAVLIDDRYEVERLTQYLMLEIRAAG